MSMTITVEQVRQMSFKVLDYELRSNKYICFVFTPDSQDSDYSNNDSLVDTYEDAQILVSAYQAMELNKLMGMVKGTVEHIKASYKPPVCGIFDLSKDTIELVTEWKNELKGKQ